MNGRIDTERILDAFLAPESDRLPDRVLDAALDDIARTTQRRALRVPWRFGPMTALTRTTGLAAVALVAAVGAGGLIYLNSPGGSGGKPTASPTQEAVLPSSAPTTAATAAPTPQPTFDPSGDEWPTFTSAVYDLTYKYPTDWRVYERATTPGQADIFSNSEDIDGDQIALFVQQVSAPAGSDLDSWEGLLAAYEEVCDPSGGDGLACPTDDPVTPMCLGDQPCRAAIIALVSDERTVTGLFGEPSTGTLTLFVMGREEDFPAAARYGGTTALLKAILAQVGVREPEPGETPH